MFDPASAKFRLDQPVYAAVDLHNDGSHPEAGDTELLAARGARGQVLRIGRHDEAQTTIYLVEFERRVVGCAEHELVAVAPGDAP
jgi:nitrogen fixation protein NifZ